MSRRISSLESPFRWLSQHLSIRRSRPFMKLLNSSSSLSKEQDRFFLSLCENAAFCLATLLSETVMCFHLSTGTCYRHWLGAPGSSIYDSCAVHLYHLSQLRLPYHECILHIRQYAGAVVGCQLTPCHLYALKFINGDSRLRLPSLYPWLPACVTCPTASSTLSAGPWYN